MVKRRPVPDVKKRKKRTRVKSGVRKNRHGDQVQTLEDLKRTYLRKFPYGRARRAVTEILKLVHRHCEVSPYDSTITYPNGDTSMSSLSQLIRFFVCSRKNKFEMPADAKTFSKFLRSYKFKTDILCNVPEE